MEQTQQQSQSTALSTERVSAAMVDMAQFKTAAEVFIKSGYFDAALGKASPEVMMARAQVKLAVGAEIGLPPFLSLQGIYWMDIEGYAPVLMKGAQVCAFVLARSSKYRYTTVREDSEAVSIEFEELRDGKWVKVYASIYTMDMAVKGGLSQKKNWLKNPIKMMWNRAMVTGANHVAADELNGPAGEFDEADYRVIDGNGHGEPAGLLPQETVERAADATEQATQPNVPATDAAPDEKEPATVAATNEPGAEKPAVAKPRTRRKAEEARADDITAPAADKPEMPPVASEDAEKRVTPEQYAELIQWVVTEKLNGAAALRKAGLPQPDALDKATQAQYAAIKAEREVYIAQADEEFGWGHKPGETLTTEQIKQLQVRAEKAARK
jgi:hypothetical protein